MIQEVTISLGFDASLLKGRLGEESARMYNYTLSAYLSFAGNEALKPTTFSQWITYLVDEGKSAATINRMRAAVVSIMEGAAEKGIDGVNWELIEGFRRVKGVQEKALKDRKREKVWLEPGEVRMLCEAPGTDTLKGLRDTALLHTLASSGLRASEVANIKVQDVKAKNGGYVVMVMGKNEVEQSEVWISEEAFGAIENWLTVRREKGVESEYIFTGFRGKGQGLLSTPMTDKSVWEAVKGYGEKIGIKLYTHALRAFFGTRVEDMYGVVAAQGALRHKNPNTTIKHYVKPKRENVSQGLY